MDSDDTQSFHVVENVKFQELIEALNPHYKLIHEKKVKKIVDSKYELISEEKLEYLRSNSGKTFVFFFLSIVLLCVHVYIALERLDHSSSNALLKLIFKIHF